MTIDWPKANLKVHPGRAKLYAPRKPDLVQRAADGRNDLMLIDATICVKVRIGEQSSSSAVTLTNK